MTQESPTAATATNPRSDQGGPTPYADLNMLLEQLTSEAQRLLGDNFVGAYLQGSFALGDFDEHSDVDWLIVTRRDLTEGELPPFRALHQALHQADNRWVDRLEGSYVPAAILRRWSEAPRDPPGQPPRPADWADPGTSGRPPRVYPLWFKGNGEARLVRSEHDNTRVVRWVTREKGVLLAGPPPRDLIDPVSAEDLKAETRGLIEEIARDWTGSARMDARWLQAFFVLLTCRLLHTLDTGQVTSKKAAAAWARAVLGRQWHGLIDRAEATRRQPPEARLAPADAGDVKETLALILHAAERARTGMPPAGAGRSREIIAKALAQKSHGHHGPGGGRSGTGGTKGGARHGQYSPPPIRPGGRGRRG